MRRFFIFLEITGSGYIGRDLLGDGHVGHTTSRTTVTPDIRASFRGEVRLGRLMSPLSLSASPCVRQVRIMGGYTGGEPKCHVAEWPYVVSSYYY